MIAILTFFSLFVLVFYASLQVIMFLLACGSAVFLRRERIVGRFDRFEDMNNSRLAPPVSIVIAAYNEAAGIVDAIQSLSRVSYPRFEIVVANDGSTDATLALLVEAFDLEWLPFPIRQSVATAPVLGVYKSRDPEHVAITVVNKVNGGRADALNAAINAARFPYVLATDADIIMDRDALIHIMRPIAQDRDRVIAVGGNIRPLNGGSVRPGSGVAPGLPKALIPRYQILEYARSFVAAKPAWASMNALPNVSGAFGVFSKELLIELGGYASGHMGEDLDITMRIHRHCRDSHMDYRMRFAPAAVVWTEVPPTRAVLRRQRIRWHRGLMEAVHDYRSSFLNPRQGAVGMLAWPFTVVFEYLAPIIEFFGYLLIPFALIFGWVTPATVVMVFFVSLFLGAFTSLLALLLDERYGYFNSPVEISRLLAVVFIENLGLRQMTVWWRVRAMFGGKSTKVWGDMERRGVTQLAS